MPGIQNITKRTPIEIALGIGEDGKTTARKLYEFLELAKRQFSRWAKTNITENPFAESSVDYEGSGIDAEGNKTVGFKLTANFAKKLSMQGKTGRAEQARDYFIKAEEKYKEVVVYAHNVKQLVITSRDIAVMTTKKNLHAKVIINIKDCIKELEDMGFNTGEFGTGCRIGEITGLQWSGWDFEKSIITIRRTASYYSLDGKCLWDIHEPEMEAGIRGILMLKEVKAALLVTVPMLVQELNINKTKIRQIAEEAGAVYKYGRLVRIDKNKLLDYFFGL